MHFELTPRFSAKIVIGIKRESMVCPLQDGLKSKEFFMQDFFLPYLIMKTKAQAGNTAVRISQQEEATPNCVCFVHIRIQK